MSSDVGYANLSAEYKCVYIHVPKTGGCSICKALDIRSSHNTALRCQQMFPRQFNDFTVFSITRHPFDRLVSAWEYIRQGGCSNAYDLQLQRELQMLWGKSSENFNEFCRVALPTICKEWLHFLPQTHYLCDEDGEVMCNYIGKYESIGYFWDFISRRLGCKAKLPHLNKTVRRGNYQGYFRDTKTKQIVTDIYQSDFVTWCYV